MPITRIEYGTEYCLIVTEHHAALESSVRDYIQAGWMPQGGASVSSVGNDYARTRYAQAMTRSTTVVIHHDEEEEGV